MEICILLTAPVQTIMQGTQIEDRPRWSRETCTLRNPRFVGSNQAKVNGFSVRNIPEHKASLTCESMISGSLKNLWTRKKYDTDAI